MTVSRLAEQWKDRPGGMVGPPDASWPVHGGSAARRRLFLALAAVVLCWGLPMDASGVSLADKLSLLGYERAEIKAIVAGSKSRNESDFQLKRRLLGFVPGEVPSGPGHTRDHRGQWAFRPEREPAGNGLFLPAKAYYPDIRRAAKQHRLPESLILAVIKAESEFNPRARSPKGAMGLMQLMPTTARDLGVDDPYNPRQNILGGSRYLARCIQRFKRTDLALAAYNAGPQIVEKSGGIPPYRETRNYIQRVLDYERRYRRCMAHN